MPRRRDYSQVDIDTAFRSAPSLISQQIQELSLRHPNFLEILPSAPPDIDFGPECNFFASWRWIEPTHFKELVPKDPIQLELPFK